MDKVIPNRFITTVLIFLTGLVMPSTTPTSSSVVTASSANTSGGLTVGKMTKESCYPVTTAVSISHPYPVTDCKPPRLPMPLQPTFSLSYYNQRPGPSTGANSLTNPPLDAHMRKELVDAPTLKTANALNLQNIPKHWIWNTSSLLYSSYGAVTAADMAHYASFPTTLGYNLMRPDASSRLMSEEDKTKRMYESDDSETSEEKKVDDEVGVSVAI